jgi:hypothetical protein
MHGGDTGASPTNETWIFDGVDWANDTPVPSGPGRRNMAVASVSGWGRGVVSCGHNGASREDDIWARADTSCIVATPVSPVSGDIAIDVDVDSPFSLATDLTFEHSTDGGVTFLLSQPAVTSPLPNPAPGTPIGMSTFLWDSAADLVGSVTPQAGVLARVSIFDVGAPAPGMADCQTLPFEVDNTPAALCQAICGDCSENGIGPEIIDALQAAQIAAGLLTPTAGQIGCCDVNASLLTDILDALIIAQGAAGLSVTLSCP